MMEKIEKYEIADLVKRAIAEDLGGYGDITSEHLIPEDSKCSGHIICKEPDGGILCGMQVASHVFKEIDPGIDMDTLKDDGAEVGGKEIICKIKGPTASVLKAERTCLNFIQHMSGISTLTSKFVDIARPYSVKIADTRKTTPGLRKLEKYAVSCGGGSNHRFGLFDGILIKDNHIAAAGSVLEAINNIKKHIPHTVKIEVEVKDFNELHQALEGRADIIMLDNMSPDTMKEAVGIIRGKHQGTTIEASGNISLKTLKSICTTGIDIVSVGAITHSAPSLDFSMELSRG